MKKILFLSLFTFVLLGSTTSFSQEESQEPKKEEQRLNCFERLEKAFNKRGSKTVNDNIHRNVIISFFEDGEVYCVRGKVRVENGYITSIFYYYDDNSEVLYDKKFQNMQNDPPSINNGISEMIVNADREKFKVIFVDKLQPKQKQLKRAVLPDDL